MIQNINNNRFYIINLSFEYEKVTSFFITILKYVLHTIFINT